MANIKVIKGKLNKFEEFYQLFKKALQDGLFLYSKNSVRFTLEEELPKNILLDEISKGTEYFFLAYQNDKPVGYLLTNITKGGVTFGHWLAVDSKYQKHGIASSLLSFWEKDALGQGAHKLWLWTTKNNVSFYKRRGFTLGGEFPDSWFGLDHFLFYKTLRKSDEKVFLKEFLRKKLK